MRSVDTRQWPAWLTPLVVVTGVALVAFAVWLSVGQWHYVHTGGAPLLLMAALGLAASAVALVSYTPTGTVVVITPTVSFTFAILLSWGLGPALVTQVLALGLVMWLRHLPVLDKITTLVPVWLGFLAADLVIVFGDPHILPAKVPAANVRDTLAVFAAIVAWLVAFGVTVAAIVRLRNRRVDWPVPATSLWYLLLFNAALIVLSPILSTTAQQNPAFIPLLLVPLVAVAIMARLAAERDRMRDLDPLTGLANRNLLRHQFESLTASSPPNLYPTLILLDLDRFKYVNDALGHDVGDQLLIAVAGRLRQLHDGKTTISRVGGDEFVVLTTLEMADGAAEVGRHAQATLTEPISLDGLRLAMTASVGVAVAARPGDGFIEVMRNADTAMYDSKQRGNAVTVYRDQPAMDLLGRLRLLADLRGALEAGDESQLAVHYQPQVNLQTGVMEGVEALLRWTHPSRGLIEPRMIISVAEPTTVMTRLTIHVINTATAQLARWNLAGMDLRMSINLSARDLHSDTLVDHLADRIHRLGLRAGTLQVEITESAVMADPDRANTILRRIADLGITIALDDFGTGYSSLHHLRHLPIDEIKIDQSFVADVAHDPDDYSIVKSTVDMAHALRHRTVAEGVEDGQTRDLLAAIGCDLGQGWLFGAATTPGRIMAHTTANPPQLRQDE